jgi:hypothetical protein
MNPLVINQAAARLTLPRRLTLACEIEEHKQVHREETKSQRISIQLTNGVPQPKNQRLVLDRNELSKTQTLEETVVAG